MASPYVGEIRVVAFNFAPPGWYPCDGRTLSISEDEVLFQLIGTTYGGDGQSTFNVPNLNGNVAVGAGSGPGLSNYALGQQGGVTDVTLNASQLPSHGHGFSSPVAATTSGPVTNSPVAALPASGLKAYSGAQSGTDTLAVGAITGATSVAGGSSGPHSNLPPTLAMNYIIANVGIYPSQP
jgi:microcystin-dependent protein